MRTEAMMLQRGTGLVGSGGVRITVGGSMAPLLGPPSSSVDLVREVPTEGGSFQKAAGRFVLQPTFLRNLSF